MIRVRRRARSQGCAALLLSALTGCAAAPGPAAAPAAPATVGDSDAVPDAPAGIELSATDIVTHLRGNETDLRRCFFANPALRGSARFKWHIDTEGKAHGVRREASTLGDPRVESCLGERLAEIRFGDLAQPATAHWTFVFRLVDPPLTASNPKAHAHRAHKNTGTEDERGLVIEPDSAGVLAADDIDNVVEAGYPLFARCYRDGVNRNSGLDGTVRLRFVIKPSGRVSEVSDGGSDLSDRQTVDCIAEGFYALRFPRPERGSVSVLYRIRFET